MIFLTVGTQEPFDRLVRAVDDWCGIRGVEVFGQIGALSAGSYRPKNFDWMTFMDADVYQEKVEQAPLLIGHAGMGSIIAALTHSKPLVMCPRRAALGEHRNDHQIATAEKFSQRAGVFLAWDESEVAGLLDPLLDAQGNVKSEAIPAVAESQLLARLRGFAHGPNERRSPTSGTKSSARKLIGRG